jgi:hypothetical protein
MVNAIKPTAPQLPATLSREYQHYSFHTISEHIDSAKEQAAAISEKYTALIRADFIR